MLILTTSPEAIDVFKTLTPAYGRDYKSAKAVKEDFMAGKDFIIADITDRYDGKPCSIRDFPAGTGITLRYKRLTMLTCVKVPKTGVNVPTK